MLAFVTGATGFLGSHVARVLAEQGAELRLLVRPTSDLRNIDDLAAHGVNADRVVGDLRDAASIEKALSGCDVVFHVAADYRLWVRGRDSNEMYRSNVEGTRAVLEAARKQGVRRVVYTSSVATMGFTSGISSKSGHVADEESPVGIADMIGHYKRSKFMAEQVAFEAARSGVDVVIVNPTTPIGERDIKPTPTGRIVLDFSEAKIPGVRGNRVEPGRCDRMCPRSYSGAGEGKNRRALHSGRRESYAEADSGPAGRDYELAVADREAALHFCAGGRSLGRDGDRPDSGPGAARDD